MCPMPAQPLEYYRRPGPMTTPCEHVALFDGLPADARSLSRVVQGCMVHVFQAWRYGLELDDARKSETQLRFVARMLARMRELQDAPLPPGRRLQPFGELRE